MEQEVEEDIAWIRKTENGELGASISSGIPQENLTFASTTHQELLARRKILLIHIRAGTYSNLGGNICWHGRLLSFAEMSQSTSRHYCCHDFSLLRATPDSCPVLKEELAHPISKPAKFEPRL